MIIVAETMWHAVGWKGTLLALGLPLLLLLAILAAWIGDGR